MPQVRVSDDISISYDVAGDGPAVLLLHGFPETRAMWAPVARVLSTDFTVVTADLRGYGASSKPEAVSDLSNYSFRAMGQDMLALMDRLGHARFHLVGHDRGARTAYRMALDAAERMTSLCLMDILPTDDLIAAWDYPVSKAYFHWSLLAQPAPLPEQMIGADPDLFFETCLLGWGGARSDLFDNLEAYRAAWRDPATIAGMVNDYRAAVGIDLELDAADAGRILDVPTLILYGADGVMAQHFDVAAAWKARFSDMRSGSIPGGHFFVDQSPDATSATLKDFLTSVP